LFKVGIVGCGGIGKTHARNWASIPGVQVVAVCDLQEEQAKACAELCDAI